MRISLIKNSASLGPYSRTLPRVLRLSYGGVPFLVSQVPSHRGTCLASCRRNPGTTIGPYPLCARALPVKFDRQGIAGQKLPVAWAYS